MAPGGLGCSWVRAMLAAGMIATLMWTNAIDAGIELSADYCAVTTSGSDEVDGFTQSYSMESDSPFRPPPRRDVLKRGTPKRPSMVRCLAVKLHSKAYTAQMFFPFFLLRCFEVQSEKKKRKERSVRTMSTWCPGHSRQQ